MRFSPFTLRFDMSETRPVAASDTEHVKAAIAKHIEQQGGLVVRPAAHAELLRFDGTLTQKNWLSGTSGGEVRVLGDANSTTIDVSASVLPALLYAFPIPIVMGILLNQTGPLLFICSAVFIAYCVWTGVSLREIVRVGFQAASGTSFT